MTLDELLEPVAEDAPCGPDLEAGMDAAFEDYYFGALGRLPSYYYRPGVERPDGSFSPDMVFDTGTVDLAGETKQIEALLSRSRDLRLLILLAQWQALASRLEPLAETFEAMAAMIETFGDAAHPTLQDGVGGRRDALNDLCSQPTMIQPLQFLGLTGTDEVSLRKIKVAAGEVTPLQSEQGLAAGALSDALSDPGNRKRVEAHHAALAKMSYAHARIIGACQAHPETPFSPALDTLNNTVAEMLSAITTARPDLRTTDIPSMTVAEAPAASGSASEDNPAAGSAPPSSGPAISNHAAAKQALEACEKYFRRSEPSSAAMLLVTQARLLIGKPLIEAIETLLPEKARDAIVDFGPQTGFALNFDRLRQLTESAASGATPEVTEEDPGPAPEIASSVEASAAMRAVEDYFAKAERSSPVPILLRRARSYVERDFQSLVDELVPLAETKQG